MMMAPTSSSWAVPAWRVTGQRWKLNSASPLSIHVRPPSQWRSVPSCSTERGSRAAPMQHFLEFGDKAEDLLELAAYVPKPVPAICRELFRSDVEKHWQQLAA